MQKYRLTVVFEFDAPDDIEARVISESIINKVHHSDIWYPDTEIDNDEKLQRIFLNRPPEKVNW